MNLLKGLFGASEEKTVANIKGIYIMSCSPGPADKRRHEQLISGALQDLKKRDRRFQRCHAQALLDKPKLCEGIQVMAAVPVDFSQYQIVDALVPKFRQWMRQQYGVEINEEKWSDYFFSKVIYSDTIHCVLIYYQT